MGNACFEKEKIGICLEWTGNLSVFCFLVIIVCGIAFFGSTRWARSKDATEAFCGVRKKRSSQGIKIGILLGVRWESVSCFLVIQDMGIAFFGSTWW